MFRNHQLLGFMLVFGGVSFYYHVVSTIQLMVSWWFGLVVWVMWWKGLLRRGTRRIPNHQPTSPLIITFPETNSSPLKIGLLPPKGNWSSKLPFSGRVLEVSLVPRCPVFVFKVLGPGPWTRPSRVPSWWRLILVALGHPWWCPGPRCGWLWDIPPKFSIAPKKWCLGDEFPFGRAYFQNCGSDGVFEVSLLEKKHAGILGCSLKQKIHCTSCKVAATVYNILWRIRMYVP